MAGIKGNHRLIALLMGSEPEKLTVQTVTPRTWGARAVAAYCRKCQQPLAIHDSKSLLVNCFAEEVVVPPRNGCMPFDYVGYASDSRSKTEVFSILDHLLVDHRNVCLMILKGHPDSSQNLLAEEMMCEMNKRIQLSDVGIMWIELAHFNSRRDGLVNMLKSHGSKLYWSHITLKTIEDVCNWLKKPDGPLRTNTRNHECIDLRFIFHDANKRVHKLTLSLIQLYIYRMETNDRLIVGENFANIATPKKGIKDQVKASVLPGCVRDYFSKKWCTFVTLEIPTLPEELNMTKEMLRLADSGVTGFKSMRAKEEGLEQTPRKQAAHNEKVSNGCSN